jgi:hypothetical protein
MPFLGAESALRRVRRLLGSRVFSAKNITARVRLRYSTPRLAKTASADRQVLTLRVQANTRTLTLEARY